MKKFDTEFAVGLFIIAGIVCLGYLSIKLGGAQVLGEKGYDIHAVFANSGGLKAGSSITVAGVEVGRVKEVILEDYQARILMNLTDNIKIQEDAIASIKTKGLIGEKYIEISPGGSEKMILAEGKIRETQPPVDIEQLISSFVFGKI
jgi:phospholipid/cholesterol/gamma-HCH transport system substrate-binding protein